MDYEYINRLQQFSYTTYDLVVRESGDIVARHHVKLHNGDDNEENKLAIAEAKVTEYIDSLPPSGDE